MNEVNSITEHPEAYIVKVELNIFSEIFLIMLYSLEQLRIR